MTITFVSAIIDLGRNSWNGFGDTAPKDGFNPNPYQYNKENYLLWFSYYLNFSVPMIIFVDEPYWDDVQFICCNKPNISLIQIDKKWIVENIDAWKYFPRVKEVMESAKFQEIVKHRLQFPNVSVPQYVTNTYSKLDYVDHAIKNGLIKTDYVAWVDFGIFKDPGYHLTKFEINMAHFSQDKIVVPVLHMPTEKDKNIIYSLTVAPDCFSAGFMAGTPAKMNEFNRTFKAIVEFFLANNLTDVEQHLLIHCYYQNPDGYNLLFCKGDYRNIYKILTSF
jgi:hypothetical protein